MEKTESVFDDGYLDEYFLRDFLEQDNVPLVGTAKHVTPSHAKVEQEQEAALNEQNMSKAELRKLRNRLSALASRKRTQNHIGYLKNMVETLQTELKNALIRLEKYECDQPSNKRRLEELMCAPIIPDEMTRKKANNGTIPKSSLVHQILAHSSSSSSLSDMDSSIEPMKPTPYISLHNSVPENETVDFLEFCI